jgi:glyoxylase-like metal-dependent hydrolase (beta-lactamase superfamily II)
MRKSIAALNAVRVDRSAVPSSHFERLICCNGRIILPPFPGLKLFNFMNNMDRRTFFQRAGLAGLSLWAVGSGANRVMADPDPAPGAGNAAAAAGSPDADIYSFQLGDADAFVILDGQFTLPSIQPMFVPEAKPAELEELLKKSFLPNHVALSLNVLVVKAKSGIMLFDAGAGGAFGPAAGKLMRGLARVGIAPGDVKVVYVTHAHSDHIAGLVDDANNPVFSSARIVAAKPEVDFWTADAPDLSGMRTPPDMTTQLAATIKKTLNGLKPKLELKQPGALSPEVEMIAAPGHTPGHSLFSLTVGGEKLLVFGDSVHLHALQFPHPEWTMAFDVDPAKAIATRRKLFKQVAAERTMCLGFHMPFPGVGHVRAAGQGYEWVPKPWVA